MEEKTKKRPGKDSRVAAADARKVVPVSNRFGEAGMLPVLGPGGLN